MKTLPLLLAVAALASGCAQAPASSSADLRLKQAYSRCITSAEGNADKVAACRTVLETLKQSDPHKAFAERESVRTFDYQQCIEAARSGAGDTYQQDCGKLWKEIRDNNQ
ncbi:ChiQ/YbfN family lipoprotein [Enterobacterales bacterium AE_CKDN230030158-1A_HGKHYDSX7]